jgi:hypothetical protein
MSHEQSRLDSEHQDTGFSVLPNFMAGSAEPTAEGERTNDLEQIHILMAELDHWAAKLREDGSLEAELAIYDSHLPEALFHATTKDAARRIMNFGLIPSPLIFEDRGEVSLSDTVDYALFCASETQGVDTSELVVLEVTTQGLERKSAKSYLRLDNPMTKGEKMHEVHYSKTINPDWIHELRPEEIAAFVVAESR